MKKLGLISLMLMLVLTFTACGSSNDESSDDNGKKVYKVGVDATYPPFEWQENGSYKGIDIDLIKEIAKREGFEIEIQSMDFKGIIPALQAKQLDVGIAGMSITDERKKVLDFSDPYFDAGLTIVVSSDNTAIKSVDDLKGKTIAVKKGTSGAKYATDNLKDANIVQFDSSPVMFEEVKSGKADALIEDYPVISYAISKDNLSLKIIGERLNKDQYGIGVLKGNNSDLLKKINKGLADMKEDGTYDKILDTYLEK